MANQCALTLVTPVIPARHDELNGILATIRTGLSSGSFKEFEKIETLHYARYVLLEDKLSNAKTNLVFSSDYDEKGKIENLLSQEDLSNILMAL